VKITVTPLERNRVSLRFDIEEGSVTKIADINFIGNKDFSERELLRQLKLTTPGWFTWFTKDDQYSKQQLTADLEALRSFYLNRGYLEFNVESTQVSITPDREKIFITVAITEGPFADFNGTVEEVLPDKGKVRVSVSLFGRPTSVELDYLQLRGY